MTASSAGSPAGWSTRCSTPPECRRAPGRSTSPPDPAIRRRVPPTGASVVGVDGAVAMVSLAGGLHPGLEFRRADAHRLPFDDASFDAVVGNFLILHLGRPEEAVREFVRVLRPNAGLALTAWDLPSTPPFSASSSTR